MELTNQLGKCPVNMGRMIPCWGCIENTGANEEVKRTPTYLTIFLDCYDPHINTPPCHPYNE